MAVTIISRRVSSECLEDREESASKTTCSDREWRCECVGLISSYSSGSSGTIPEYSDNEGYAS